VSQLPKRGEGLFDDAALIQALAAPPVDEGTWCEVDSALFEQYNAYYSLGFEALGAKRAYGVFAVGQERIFAQTFVPQDRKPAAWALVCHGYYDHMGLYGHLVSELLQRNIAVIGFDQIGHGLSTGPQATIEDFQRYIQVTEVAHKIGQRLADALPLHWFGQSMGGALTMEYWQQQRFAQNDQPNGEMILLAPLIRPYAWPGMRWVFELAKRTVASRPRDISTNIDNPDFVTLLSQDPLQARTLPVAWVIAMVNWFRHFESSRPSALKPVIIHGYEDRTVSYRHNLPVLARIYPQSQLQIVPPARHHLVNETPEIQAAIWERLDAVCDWTSPRGEAHAV
jgi:alpha-beta hydrolase superfamily lysophospholipase